LVVETLSKKGGKGGSKRGKWAKPVVYDRLFSLPCGQTLAKKKGFFKKRSKEENEPGKQLYRGNRP